MAPQLKRAGSRGVELRAYPPLAKKPTPDEFWPAKHKWNEFSPVLYVVKRMALAPANLFSGADFAVASVIAEMMGRDASSGQDVCFAGLGTIASRSKYSLGTVKRSLARLCDGPLPLLARKCGGVTRGHYHLCNQYSLIRDPQAVAQALRHQQRK